MATPGTQVFQDQIRARILQGDSSVLQDIDRLLRDDRMPDEPRQHALCWLHRAMHNAAKRPGLAIITDWRRFLWRIGRRNDRNRRQAESIRVLHETAYARTHAHFTTQPRLSSLEIAELLRLVCQRAFARNAFDAEVFLAVALRHKSYASVAAGLAPRYGPISVDGLRVSVSRVRADLRSQFGQYLGDASQTPS